MKSEAIKLVREHYEVMKQNISQPYNFDNAKEMNNIYFNEACDHAILSVDRMIKEVKIAMPNTSDYWQSVKQEIINLKKI